MGRMERQKGQAAEREVVKLAKEAGFEDAQKRSQYRGGKQDGVDVRFWCCDCEVKRREKINYDAAYDQAVGDADPGQYPVVVARKSRQDWRVMLSFEDFLELVGDARRWRERA